jgi:hypothetical protein
VVDGQDGAAGRHGGAGQVDPDLVVVVDRVGGLLQLLDLHAAVLAGRDLGLALGGAHDDLGLPLGVPHLLPVAVAAVQLDAGVAELALLALDVGGGGADQPLGRLLLDRHRRLVRGQVAAMPGQRAVAQVGDLVDQVQQEHVGAAQELGGQCPARPGDAEHLSRVDLPEPLAPMSPVRPGPTTKLSPSKTTSPSGQGTGGRRRRLPGTSAPEWSPAPRGSHAAAACSRVKVSLVSQLGSRLT